MRDPDLVVSVDQHEDNARLSNEAYELRGNLVKTLLDDLSLRGVTVEGHFVYGQGKPIRYRIHRGNAVIDAVGELIFHNRYSYVDNNPVNRTDPSGLCWLNNSASLGQQAQCSDAWFGYMDVINQQCPITCPVELLELVQQEADYWGNLSYPEFVAQWNSSRAPASTDPGAGLQQSATVAVGAAAITGPTPDDLFLLAGALCLYAISVAVQTGAISLPLRQPFDFSIPWDDADSTDIPIPIPYPDDFSHCTVDMKPCSILEEAGGFYYGFDDALNALIPNHPDAVERISERTITSGSHCPGIGSHSQFYDTGYAGSITCCPCCNEFLEPDVRCFYRRPPGER
jgi:hypothetical protein